MTPLRRIREARRKAAEADRIMDDRIAKTTEVYNEVFRTLIRTQEDLAIQKHERHRREAGLNGA